MRASSTLVYTRGVGLGSSLNSKFVLHLVELVKIILLSESFSVKSTSWGVELLLEQVLNLLVICSV